MKVASSLSGQAIAMYPATLQHSFITRVIKFADDSEQRWTVSRELFSAVLQYHDLNGYDLSVMSTFFRLMRGMYVDTSLANTFSITIDSATYNYCVFDQDSLDVQCDSNTKYSFQLAIRQVRPN